MAFTDEFEKLQPLHDYAARCRFAVLPHGEPELVDLIITWEGGEVRFVLGDEYGDARPSNPALCLALLKFNAGELLDAPTPAAWALLVGLEGTAEETAAAYKRNKAALTRLEEALGPIPNLISDFDWSLNAGRAQALRSLG